MSDTAKAFLFGPYCLIPDRRALIANGQEILVRSRAFDLLLALVQRRERVVAKEELLGLVWPGRVVEEGNLTVHIASLRRLLGNGLIVTLPGRGYRFVASVEESALGDAAKDAIKDDRDIQTSSAAGSSVGSDVAFLPNALPRPLTRLVGRTDDLQRVEALLEGSPLVTIVGPGGIGKTRLVLAAIDRVQACFPDGIWFADLGPVSDPKVVPATIVSALGLDVPNGDLLRNITLFLCTRRGLLIMDSCEHLLRAVAEAAEGILRASPGIKIIATSREPLRAEGESLHRLRPLATAPANANVSAEKLKEYPASELFTERARAILGDFAPTDAQAQDVMEICRLLDGIPFAIELAVPRLEALPLAELREGLDNRFELLTAGRRTALPRQQTLRATIGWSYDLLSEPERIVLRRVAVLVGSFGLKAASAVAASEALASTEVTEKLLSLVTKSLIVAVAHGGDTRYRLLDTTRAFILEKLGESGELETITRRHALYIRDLLEMPMAGSGNHDLRGPCPAEIGNIRAALAWAFSSAGEVTIGVELAAASAPTWLTMTLLAECRGWMAAALNALPPEAFHTQQEMVLQLALGCSLMLTQGLSDDAQAALMRAYELGQIFDNLGLQLRALVWLVIFRRMSADFQAAVTLSRRVDAIASKIATPLSVATADGVLASSLLWVGEYAEARPRAERGGRRNSPEIRRAHLIHYGYDHHVHCQTRLAQILWLQGFPEQSLQLTRDVLTEATQTSHPLTLSDVLTTAGCLVPLWIGDLELAEQSISRLNTYAGTHGLRSYQAAAQAFQGRLYAARGDMISGRRVLQDSVVALHETGFYLYYTASLSWLAEILGVLGETDEALAAANKAIEHAERRSNYWWLPEALRVKGEILLRSTQGKWTEGREHFVQAMNLARQQGALAWELRAATSLGLLLRAQSRFTEAKAVVQPVFNRFSEGLETADLKAVSILLGSL